MSAEHNDASSEACHTGSRFRQHKISYHNKKTACAVSWSCMSSKSGQIRVFAAVKAEWL